MAWLLADPARLWQAALKAVLLFLAVLALLRITDRRTLAELAPFDFVAMVSVGAVLGRTATASDTGLLVGVVALVSLVAAHQLVARLRRRPVPRRMVDRPIQRLVDEGRVIAVALRRAGLVEADLYAALRQHGVARLAEVRYVFYETRGRFSVVGWSAPTDEEPVASALAASAPYVRPVPRGPDRP
ncbi:DUF421 domain-containing protein [Plantactinospora sp. KBS50]|uniref:DUF421 domain-containing protein n=1 Tax=Plantactinospora sp. KBS50 TaxID=2024580 RepID=UPI000BAAD166|nr:YetF domain-containing protein [Plantactinospora sp. KBS50]ASW55174.1 hypothetical protein CIK06_14810 [Plantactinospora sp. KBS50]